jgi:hypothetical protein
MPPTARLSIDVDPAYILAALILSDYYAEQCAKEKGKKKKKKYIIYSIYINMYISIDR